MLSTVLEVDRVVGQSLVVWSPVYIEGYGSKYVIALNPILTTKISQVLWVKRVYRKEI